VRFLCLALAVGGAAGAVANFFLFEDFWVWPMPELAYRLLAAAATAYVAGGVLALLSRERGKRTFLMWTVVIYGLPLLAAALISNDVIDRSARITVLFLLIVAMALAICAAYLPASGSGGRNVRGHCCPTGYSPEPSAWQPL
jgi:hypothetical protein